MNKQINKLCVGFLQQMMDYFVISATEQIPPSVYKFIYRPLRLLACFSPHST